MQVWLGLVEWLLWEVAWEKGVAVLGLQPLTVPARLLGALVCNLLPLVAVILYEGWLLRQYHASQRSRPGSSRATSSASAQKATGTQEVDKPALPAQHASSSMGSDSQPPRTCTTSDTGEGQQAGGVHMPDLPVGNLAGIPLAGGADEQSSLSVGAAAAGQPAAGKQFVYKRPKGCLRRCTIAVKVMHPVTVLLLHGMMCHSKKCHRPRIASCHTEQRGGA